MEKWSNAIRKRLLSNRFVERITESHVYFTAEFKIMAIQAYDEGKRPKEIFIESGIDTSIFGDDFPKKSISRWRKIFEKEGELGLRSERRGKKATGRPKDKKFKSQEAELAYLRLENELLKKLHALADSKVKKSTR